MPTSEPAEVANSNTVRESAASRALTDDVADGRRANEKTVVVVMHARIIFVPGSDKFRGVTRKEKVLQIDVSKHNLLVTAIKSVEAAVGVFLKKLKIRGVVLDAVALPVAENAQTGLLVNEKKAAEIGIELLNAGARGDEIVVVAEIVKLHLNKGFLEADVIVEAICASAHVGADDAKLADVEVVETELRRDADAPIDWLERRVAMEKIEAETQSLIEKGLFTAAEKTGTAGLRRAHTAGGRNATAIEKCFRRSGDVQENLLAENFWPNRLIAFEAIAIEGVVPVGLGVEVFALLRVTAIVRLIERPPIGNRVVNIGDGRQIFRRKFGDVIGIGIEPMTKFAIAAKGGR